MIDTDINYFTEVEEHFRVARGTPLFMFSPLDWALLDVWKNAGIPVQAVLRGIDVAFERWRKRPAQARTQMVNTLSYCAQPIAEEAQAMANAVPLVRKKTKPPFELPVVRDFIARNAATLREKGRDDWASSLESVDLDTLYSNLEQLEALLTAIEEKMIASLRASASEETLLKARADLDKDLKPYRGKMTSDQIERLETQFLERRLLYSEGLPRLSLFYL